MKFEDALKLLREGKKIKNEYWDENEYVCIKSNTLWFSGRKYSEPSASLLSDDWKLYEEPILEDEEKEYLSNVIKPFRDRINGITKEKVEEFEYIVIYVGGDDTIILPNFKKGTMYNGMELYKQYTLEELGL